MRTSLDLTLPDGEVLAGSLERPGAAPEPTPAALLLHGFTGHKAEDGRLFVRLARALAAEGVASLRIDFRGSGDSDGDFADLTLERELDDARAAMGRLAALPAVDPARLALVGLSLGSAVAQLLAGERPDLAALVLWAPVTRPGELFRDAGEPEPRPGYRVLPSFYASCARARPLEALARFAGPLLCVSGSRDYLPRAWAEEARATSRHPDSALELVDGEHTFGSDAGKARAVALTCAWLRARLGVRC